ncbi:hypothetical protein TNCV_2314541 [Trichonephila clavipes]|nr:hypothetical protein TNCV_2314541 [Trichonephila clavipes]
MHKYQNLISYPDHFPSIIRLVPHGPNVPVLLSLTELPVIPSEFSDTYDPQVQGSDTKYKPSVADAPQFSQVELNDVTRYLGLPK